MRNRLRSRYCIKYTDNHLRWCSSSVAETIRQTIYSKGFHALVVALTICDVALLFISIVIEETAGKHRYYDTLEGLSYASLAILSFFMLEIVTTLFVFGPMYYWKGEGWMMRCFDAAIVVTSFSFELAFRGTEEQIAALLIVLRLWRIFKIVTTTTIVIDEQLTERIEALERENQQLRDENAKLRAAVAAAAKVS